VGQIAIHKGPDLLIEAIRGLPPGSVELVIYGPHNQDPAYMQRLTAAAVGLPVTFPGTFAPARMAEILADFDVLCLPSRWAENGPLVLLNALATHTPVLVSDMGGMTEFLNPDGKGGYRDGLTFPMGDLTALRRIVHDLAAHPARIRAMSANTAYPRTTVDMVQDTLAAYRQAGLPA
jgi:glycosyltransferase involved in cell wall biosynthesis